MGHANFPLLWLVALADTEVGCMLPPVVDVRVRAVLRESREAISRPLVILNFILGMGMLGYCSVMFLACAVKD